MTVCSMILAIKVTVTRIEEALLNDCLGVSKVCGKIRIPAIYNFATIYP